MSQPLATFRVPGNDPLKPRVYSVVATDGSGRRGWVAKIDADPEQHIMDFHVRIHLIVWPTWSDAIACVGRYFEAVDYQRHVLSRRPL